MKIFTVDNPRILKKIAFSNPRINFINSSNFHLKTTTILIKAILNLGKGFLYFSNSFCKYCLKSDDNVYASDDNVSHESGKELHQRAVPSAILA